MPAPSTKHQFLSKCPQEKSPQQKITVVLSGDEHPTQNLKDWLKI
jgi:hypothetical protein